MEKDQLLVLLKIKKRQMETKKTQMTAETLARPGLSHHYLSGW